MGPFVDRQSAGLALAKALAKHPLQRPALVLGLPRGGVPVAYEVAQALHLPLDVMVVRKVGLPGQPELAVGAIASGNITVRDADDLFGLGERFERIAERERGELARRERAYRGDAPPLDLHGTSVILVDDGLATGSTMLAAVRAARQAGAASVIVAVPVGSPEAVTLLRREADEVIILSMPPMLRAIGEWYEDFHQLEDADVCRLLERAARTAKSKAH